MLTWTKRIALSKKVKSWSGCELERTRRWHCIGQRVALESEGSVSTRPPYFMMQWIWLSQSWRRPVLADLSARSRARSYLPLSMVHRSVFAFQALRLATSTTLAWLGLRSPGDGDLTRRHVPDHRSLRLQRFLSSNDRPATQVWERWAAQGAPGSTGLPEKNWPLCTALA